MLMIYFTSLLVVSCSVSSSMAALASGSNQPEISTLKIKASGSKELRLPIPIWLSKSTSINQDERHNKEQMDETVSEQTTQELQTATTSPKNETSVWPQPPEEEKDEKDNVHQMIMSVLGDDAKDTMLHSSHEDTLVQKLMDGEMVVAAYENREEKSDLPRFQPSNFTSDSLSKSETSSEVPETTTTKPRNSIQMNKQVLEEQNRLFPYLKPARRLEINTFQCQFNGTVYENGESIQMNHPCDRCKCRRGRVSCFFQQCGGAPGFDCVPLFIPGSCCPVYSCKKENMV